MESIYTVYKKNGKWDFTEEQKGINLQSLC